MTLEHKNAYRLVEADVMPVRAPCKPDGEVTSVDDDTKDAICQCQLNPRGCFVDGRNMVIQDRYILVPKN